MESVKRVQEPYKKANRKFHPDDTVDRPWPAARTIGGGRLAIIAGPCSVEMRGADHAAWPRGVKAAGRSLPAGRRVQAPHLPLRLPGPAGRGPASCCCEAKKETGLPIVTEIMNTAHLALFEDVDIIQVGARNMQNFELLKELGKLRQAHPAQAGPGQHHRGAADERRIHHGRRATSRSSSASGASAPLKP